MKLNFSPQLLKKAEHSALILIGLTIAITVGVTIFTSKQSLTASATAIPWGAIVWLIIASLVESVLRFWRYQVAAKALHLNVSVWRLGYYYTVGYALLPTPGKLGTAIRIWLLKQYHGLPYRRTMPLMVMDFLSDGFSMLALACLALAALNLHNPLLNHIGIFLAVGLVIGVIGALIAPSMLRNVVKMIFVMGGRRQPRKFGRILSWLHTCRSILGWRVLGLTTALSFIGWFLIGLAIGHLVTELGAPLSAAAGTLAITLSTMGGLVTMMPAGVGGAEAAMVGLFSIFGVPLSIAIIATALVRLFVTWITVVIGLILLPIALKNVPPQTE